MWKFLLVLPLFSIDAGGYVQGNSYAQQRENRDESTAEKGSQCGSMCSCMVGPGGPSGVPGVPGINGWPGERGSKGEKGDRGEQGFQGLAGEIGRPGPTGPEGTRGRRGYPGDPGKVGEQGRQGAKGDRGFTGMPGLKGSKGDPASRPIRIAFSVFRSQKLGPVLEDTTITFDKVFTNLGGGFDERTSHFVCKTNGTYLFMAHILGQENQDAHAWIMLNNHHQVPIHADSRAGYGTGSQTFIMHLKHDDHIYMTLANQSGLLNDYTTFSGYLLYEDDPEQQEELSNYLETNDFNDYWKFK